MNIKPFAIGAAIYIVLAILIGYFVSTVAIYAAAIAAILAGIWIGRVAATVMKAVFNGLLVGLIGGIVGGLILPYLPAVSGVSLSVIIGGPLAQLVGLVAQATSQWIAIPALGIVGFIFGAIGGFVGKKYLPKK